MLAGLVLVAVLIRLPTAWSAYHDWRLRRMPIASLEAVVRREPGNVRARYQLGLAYARANRNWEASREFREVLQRNPVRPDVLNDLGVAYLSQERFYESLVALQGAVTAKPDFAAAHANLGRLHLATKMPYTATRDLERAATLDPDNSETLCDLGEAYQRTLNLRSAEAVYRRALRANPRQIRAHVGLGRTYYSMGEYDRAEKVLNDALAANPADAAALVTLGRVRMERAASDADLRAARDLVQRAVQSDPEDPEAWYDLGRLDLRLGNAAAAVQRLTRSLQLSPGQMGALYQLERALRAAGRKAEADRAATVFRSRSLREREETRLEERISRAPDDWNAKARLAVLYLQSGKQGMAALIYRQLKDGKPDHPSLPALTQLMNPPATRPVPPALLQEGR